MQHTTRYNFLENKIPIAIGTECILQGFDVSGIGPDSNRENRYGFLENNPDGYRDCSLLLQGFVVPGIGPDSNRENRYGFLENKKPCSFYYRVLLYPGSVPIVIGRTDTAFSKIKNPVVKTTGFCCTRDRSRTDTAVKATGF